MKGSAVQAGGGVDADVERELPATRRSAACSRVRRAYASISAGGAPKPARARRWRASSMPSVAARAGAAASQHASRKAARSAISARSAPVDLAVGAVEIPVQLAPFLLGQPARLALVGIGPLGAIRLAVSAAPLARLLLGLQARACAWPEVARFRRRLHQQQASGDQRQEFSHVPVQDVVPP